MAIDFTADVFPLYATNVVTETAYSDIPAERRDAAGEQAILTMIEVMRAFMAQFTTYEEARIAHYALARMLAAYPKPGTVGSVEGADKAVSDALGHFQRPGNPDL